LRNTQNNERRFLQLRKEAYICRQADHRQRGAFPASRIEAILDAIDAPKTLSQVGTEDSMLPLIIKATKDIRDKYVLSRLL